MFCFRLLTISAVFIAVPAMAQTSLKVPARELPVPTTVSPQMQKLIGAPLNPEWVLKPATGEEWKPISDARVEAAKKRLPVLAERMKVTIEKSMMGGVKVYIITPQTIAAKNRDHVLINLHGGCYVLNPQEAALPEAVMMAGFSGIKVIAVDYRIPPEAYYPAALDDGMAVWKELLKTVKPENIGIFGTSAGGGLTLAMMLQAKTDNIPMPAVIAPGSPMSDATGTGDSFYTNAMVDNVFVSSDGFCDAGTRVYANGHDLSDPLLSPVYGDMTGFPPAILTTGTRDLLLSNTVRVHRKLRQAGIDAALHVYEGQSHGLYLRDETAPETKEVFAEITAFFNRYLGQKKSD